MGDLTSDTPPPSSDPATPCAQCGYPVCSEILADAPACPHGWISLDGMALADIKAIFAAGAPELSLDPEASQP